MSRRQDGPTFDANDFYSNRDGRSTFRVLFVFVVLSHSRRRVVYFNVTDHPTALWTGQQIVQAFPEETAPRYLLRDQDKIFAHVFQDHVSGMGIEEMLTALQSPWQSPFVERLIGSIRRDCLDHLIGLGDGICRES